MTKCEYVMCRRLVVLCEGRGSDTSKHVGVFLKLQDCERQVEADLPHAEIRFSVINRSRYSAGVFKGTHSPS